jgi:hypothetical protein
VGGALEGEGLGNSALAPFSHLSFPSSLGRELPHHHRKEAKHHLTKEEGMHTQHQMSPAQEMLDRNTTKAQGLKKQVQFICCPKSRMAEALGWNIPNLSSCRQGPGKSQRRRQELSKEACPLGTTEHLAVPARNPAVQSPIPGHMEANVIKQAIPGKLHIGLSL